MTYMRKTTPTQSFYTCKLLYLNVLKIVCKKFVTHFSTFKRFLPYISQRNVLKPCCLSIVQFTQPLLNQQVNRHYKKYLIQITVVN